MSMINMSEIEFARLSKIIQDVAGINLVYNPKNVTLMTSRLNKFLIKYNISSYDNYAKILNSNSKDILEEFVSAMTTNTTSFYRESIHFDKLKQVVPQLLALKPPGRKTLRVWCSVASTGQEPYTILFTLLDGLIDTEVIELKFLASDIDIQVLEKAREGKYHERELSSVPDHILNRFFKKKDSFYQVKDEFRKMITFARFNLVQENYEFDHKFDIVFCRNVLIYFQQETIKLVIRNIRRSMSDSGYLFLGHSESGLADRSIFDSQSSALYKARGKAA